MYKNGLVTIIFYYLANTVFVKSGGVSFLTILLPFHSLSLVALGSYPEGPYSPFAEGAGLVLS
jgi:hypothetical protein